jgi:alpha-D-ribose 1-methylphosphonate 5-triphosphate synthase subunit PhnG
MKQSWRFIMKLSSIIDNFSQARPIEMASGETKGESTVQVRRKAAMAVLAHSNAAAITERLTALAVPEHQDLREAENGLVMLRGRIGGDGAPFNLGEATVSRAAVRLATGEVGFGYTLGRDRAKARMIALCDAMVQSEQFANAVEAKVIAPLRAAILAERSRKAAETAATRVDFYTLVRGEG